MPLKLITKEDVEREKECILRINYLDGSCKVIKKRKRKKKK